MPKLLIIIIMKQIKTMKSEKLQQEVTNIFDMQLFNTQLSLAQVINLDAQTMAKKQLTELNRNIAISPHRHCC